MPLKAYWAYDFGCELTIEAILVVFNEAGPWQWVLSESAWYGDYLNTRPAEGGRVRVHEYPQSGDVGSFVGRRDKGFSALLQIDDSSSASQADVDEVFRRLLSRITATDVVAIEPYD
jgi:hypothetical protein